MTLPDAIGAVLEERGPLSAGALASEVRRRKADVLAALHTDGRFVHTGKRRASRWGVAPAAGSFTPADAAECWGCPLALAEEFLAGFEENGLVERINGNGSLRATDDGLELSAVLRDVAPSGLMAA